MATRAPLPAKGRTVARVVDDDDAPPAPLAFVVGYLLPKLLLEVCGASGAVWGFCEIVDWRSVENTDDFRPVVTVAFVLFAIRCWVHSRIFLRTGEDFPDGRLSRGSHYRCHLLRVFVPKFVLQVMGAAGAVWGASETLTLRTADPANREAWRAFAIWTTVAFGTRWILHLAAYVSPRPLVDRSRPPAMRWAAATTTIVPAVEMVVVRFVLEVCGSTGAVWGFADILSVRDVTPDAAVGWRFVALTVGGVFWVRWMCQVQRYFHFGEEQPPLVGESSRRHLDDLLDPPSPTSTASSGGSDSFEDEDDEEAGILVGRRADATAYGSTDAGGMDRGVAVS